MHLYNLNSLRTGMGSVLSHQDLKQDLDLLRNVLYSGVWQRYLLKQEKTKRKEGANGE